MADGVAPSVAFVTPSYLPDLQRCQLLVESIRTFAPQITHYLIVEKRDFSAFRHLASSKTILIEAEDLLTSYWRAPTRKGLWLSFRAGPVRGWIAQQMMKLAALTVASEDVLLCLDSDVTFLRPFGLHDVMIGHRLGLLDVGYTKGMVAAWTRTAEKLLGLTPGSVILRGHVGNLVAWSRHHLLELHNHLEMVADKPWQIALGRHFGLSEYILYGAYIRAVVGYDQSRHAPSVKPLVRPSWDKELSTPAALDDFVSKLDPDNVAVMFHSKDQVPFEVVRPLLLREMARWS